MERQRLDVSEARVHAPPARELDHPLGEVDSDDVSTELAGDPFAQLSGPAADLQHVDRVRRGDDPKRLVAGIRPLDVCVDRPASLKPGLLAYWASRTS